MSVEHELSVTRFIHASPETVWSVWTQRTEEWFCPHPWKAVISAMDMQPGGAFAMMMHGPDGAVFPNAGVFLEVVPHRRIVNTDAYTAGWVPQTPFMTAIMTFETEGAGTRYTAVARHWDQAACERHEEMGFAQGWGTVADQLALLCEAAGGQDSGGQS